MLKLTKKADYGLIALKHLAVNAPASSSAKEIAETYGIPAALLSKILQKLVKNGFLRSEHGTNGESTDTTEIHSLVHFDNLPLDEILPAYLRVIARESTHAAGSTELEVESNLITNPLNQLVSFYSKFRPKSGQSLVRIDGTVEGDKLKLAVHMGDTAWDTELPMPEDKIRDSFAPEMQLRGLHLGQSWTIVSYSPLALPSHPLDMIRGRPPTEVLFARVEEEVPLPWNGALEPTWVVVYRTDAGESPDNDKNIRNRLWIHHDGTVVRQEVHLGDHNLRFSRMNDQEAVKLRGEHKEFQRQTGAVQP
ncbi:MAG: RrF2 family transcriptional regulator [Bryobacteraceae bacterium]